MTIEIEIDDREINETLDRLIRAAVDLTPAMRKASRVMLEAAEDAFASESDPVTGNSWPDLLDATKERRAKQGKWPGRILQVQGNLVNSITRDYGADFAEVGSNEPYAATHQFGDDRRNIAKRPFLGLSDDDLDEIHQVLADYLDEATT